MVGAAVLLVALVVVVPAVLDGRGDLAADGTEPAAAPIDLRTHTIQVDDVTPRPPVPRPAAVPTTDASIPVPAADGDAAERADAGPPTDGGEPVPVEVRAAEPGSDPDPDPEPGSGSQSRAEPATAAAATSAAAAPVPAATPAPAPAGEWVVQLGSFAQRGNADRLAGAVRARGFAADVSATRGGSGRLYRVRVGPATTRAAADARAEALAAAGYRGSVTRQ